MNTEEDEFRRIEREALRRAARDEDDDTQVYKDHGDALTIAYQSGYYAGKKAAQRPWVDLTGGQILALFDSHNVYGSKWLDTAGPPA